MTQEAGFKRFTQTCFSSPHSGVKMMKRKHNYTFLYIEFVLEVKTQSTYLLLISFFQAHSLFSKNYKNSFEEVIYSR